MKASKINSQDTRWVFLKKGTCSRTLFYILNREFGYPMEPEEIASDPMAGGIMQHGYQCGIIWGTALAIGAESYRRSPNLDEAITLAISATQVLLNEFTSMAGSAECEEITGADMTNQKSFRKYMISGKFLACFKLADKWAPEAIKLAEKALSPTVGTRNREGKSCASELVREMGGSEMEISIVAGLAGGLGLSGSGCGALSAAIWMHSLRWSKDNPGKSSFGNPRSNRVLEAFLEQTDYEFECRNICGMKFNSQEEHKTFINQGGCSTLIKALAKIEGENN